MLPEQPVFALRIEMLGRAGHVLVNGVPVFRNYDGLPTTLQVPVTEFMLNGANEFGFALFDDPDDQIPADAITSVTLILRQNGSPKTEGIVLGTVALDGYFPAEVVESHPIEGEAGTAGPAVIERSEGLINGSRPFASEVRLPAWAWSRSTPFESTADVRDELEQFYRRLWSALADNNRLVLEQLIGEKAIELAQAYYLSPEAAVQMIELSEKPFERGWTLETPRWQEAVVDRAAEGRLARLAYEAGAAPVIVYRDEYRNFHAFDMWWRRQDGDWVLTR